MRNIHVVLFGLLLSTSAFAALLERQNGANNIEGVTLAASATAKLESRSTPLLAVGAGLRTKKVAIIKVNVYVAELFASKNYKKGPAHEALQTLAQDTAAIQLHFLREVDSEKVEKGFKEGLEANGIKFDIPAIAAFLKAVHEGGEIKKGQTLTIASERLPDGEQIWFEAANGKVTTIKGGNGTAQAIFSIWLGKTSDSGLEKLQSELLK